jgi:hypothetical protein
MGRSSADVDNANMVRWRMVRHVVVSLDSGSALETDDSSVAVEMDEDILETPRRTTCSVA